MSHCLAGFLTQNQSSSPARLHLEMATATTHGTTLHAQIHPVIVPLTISGTTSTPQIFLHLAGGDLRRAREVDDLAALLLQEVELALPVVADDEGVRVVFVNVGLLLAPALLRDDQVDVADGLEQLDADLRLR